MTERTFREPSPNRGPSARHRGDEPPPLPPMPKEYASPPPVPAKSHRRPASVEPPERVFSPPPKLTGGRGVSLDRGPGVKTARPSKQTRAKNSSVGNSIEPESETGKGSVNFSRPMSPLNTPPMSPLRDTQPFFSPKKPVTATKQSSLISALSSNERENIRTQVQQAANNPVKKKKASNVSTVTQGSHLASGGLGGRPTGSALEVTPTRQIPSVQSTPSPSSTSQQSSVGTESNANVPKKKKKKRATSDGNSQDLQPTTYASDSDTASVQSVSSDRPRNFNTRAAGLLTKQPSIVREDREAEELEEQGNTNKQSTPKRSQNGNARAKASTVRDIGQQAPNKPPVQHETQLMPTKTADNLAPQAVPAPKPTLDISRINGKDIKRESLSPTRAAHFSTTPLYATPDGTKHQPLPRSVSPAKSALKNSPSTRGASPAGVTPSGLGLIAGHTPSEASDTTSIVSEDGYRSVPKKKKSVRVSFDDDPIIVGKGSSPPTSPESPIAISTQQMDASGRDKKGLLDVKDDAIKPVPTLPSFGSIRGRRVKDDTIEDQRQYVPTDTRSSLGASNDFVIGNVLAQYHSARANGSASHDSNKASSNEPIPPEVTSVEGSGYQSDTESNPSNDGDIVKSDQRLEKIGSSNATVVSHSTLSDENLGTPQTSSSLHPHIHGDTVPSIAIQPATPGIEESSQSAAERWLGMPGGFPVSTESMGHVDIDQSPIVEHHATDPTPSSIGIAEPIPEKISTNQTLPKPLAGEVAETLRQQSQIHDDNASDTSNDSIYSDAAEDLSDVEGDGFGSINAIIESPAIALPKISEPGPLASTGDKDVSTAADLNDELSEPRSEEGWDKAQAYWSGLSQSRKQQLEQDASQGAEEELAGRTLAEAASTSTTEPKPKPKKKKVVPKKEPETVVDQPPRTKKQNKQQRVSQVDTAPPALKKSMRGSSSDTQDAPQIRSSMRNPSATAPDSSHMRSSMRSGNLTNPALRESKTRSTIVSSGSPDAKVALQKKQRPVSAIAMIDYSRPVNGTTTGKNRVASGDAPLKPLTPVTAKANREPTAVKSSLRRQTSNGSDSSSSFTKARPTTSDGGRYTMRRSMRSSSVDERPSSQYGSQLSGLNARPASPTGSSSRRPFGTAGTSMRTSMREPVQSSAARTSKSPPRSLGFGKGASSKSAPVKSASRFSSRFADSSDEEGGPKAFGSRYADSSDEDEPVKLPARLTPIRGIPKRIDEGDSTDLEDSSAEEEPPPVATTKSTSARPNKTEGATLASGSLRGNGHSREASKSSEIGNGLVPGAAAAEKDKKKRSFFGSLGRRRESSNSIVTRANVNSPPHLDPPPAVETNRNLKSSTPASPSTSQAQASPKSPKLQRRNTPKRILSLQSAQAEIDSWPLPQSPATTDRSSRPNTSDGNGSAGVGVGRHGVAGVSGRSGLGQRGRRSTLENEGNGVVLGKGGKKKRFPLLRKAFGLHD